LVQAESEKSPAARHPGAAAASRGQEGEGL
jgi:hypothetical protein